MRVRCAKWRDEVRAATPVLTIRPVDDRGQAIRDAVVRVDGALVDPAGPVPVDPGPHELRADHAGRRFVTTLDPRPGAQEVTATIDLRDRVETRPAPAAFFALGATAAAGLLAYGGFGIATLVEAGKLDACSPFCDPSSRGPLQATEVAADVGLGVGVAAALAATLVYLARPTVLREVRLGAGGLGYRF